MATFDFRMSDKMASQIVDYHKRIERDKRLIEKHDKSQKEFMESISDKLRIMG